jgi:hypothetical protein
MDVRKGHTRLQKESVSGSNRHTVAVCEGAGNHLLHRFGGSVEFGDAIGTILGEKLLP